MENQDELSDTDHGITGCIYLKHFDLKLHKKGDEFVVELCVDHAKMTITRN